ncbi:putative gustatory receptor 39b [Eupeodes corollae]|uniref:putative gustatory receptor 39b n=1 Tax=Eupeodes corollae TaxID=290404 RepID=UPI00248F85BE|nr:putative gustatory receptor 39b [Eupeodes corollae]
MWLTKNPIIICKLFGLAPFSEKRTVQLILIIYSYLLSLTLVITYIFTFSLEIEDNGRVLSNVASSILFASQVLAHLVNLIESSNKQLSQTQFFVKIKEFDDLFRLELHYRVNTQNIEKKLIRKYFVVAIIIIFCYLVNMYSVSTHLYFYGGFASVATLRIRFVQEEVYLELLNARFDILSTKLQQIIISKDGKNCGFLDMNYELIGHPKKLMLLKESFTKLYEAVEYFNNSFGLSLLFSISSYFLDFTCNSYWLLLTMDNKRPYYMLCDYSTTLIQLWLQLSMICRTCDKCSEYGIRTKNLLQKLFRVLKHGKAKASLEQFFLHVYLRPISIHATYFFKINLVLLGAILSSIISSLVILIQFLVIEDEMFKIQVN